MISRSRCVIARSRWEEYWTLQLQVGITRWLRRSIIFIKTWSLWLDPIFMLYSYSLKNNKRSFLHPFTVYPSQHQVLLLLLIYWGQSLLENIILSLRCCPIEVQFDVQPQLMNWWQRVHFILHMVSSVLFLNLCALFRSVIMLNCLIQGPGVRSSKNGCSKLLHCDVTKIFMA